MAAVEVVEVVLGRNHHAVRELRLIFLKVMDVVGVIAAFF
jgi:hypothetical protein